MHLFNSNFSLQKSWILESIVGLVLDNHSSGNVLAGPNHCTSMENLTFILLFEHSATDKVRKDETLENLQSHDRMLSHCLPILCILTTIGRNYSNQFKSIYLET